MATVKKLKDKDKKEKEFLQCEVCGRRSHNCCTGYEERSGFSFCVCPHCLMWSNDTAAIRARRAQGAHY